MEGSIRNFKHLSPMLICELDKNEAKNKSNQASYLVSIHLIYLFLSHQRGQRQLFSFHLNKNIRQPRSNIIGNNQRKRPQWPDIPRIS